MMRLRCSSSDCYKEVKSIREEISNNRLYFLFLIDLTDKNLFKTTYWIIIAHK